MRFFLSNDIAVERPIHDSMPYGLATFPFTLNCLIFAEHKS